MLEHLAELAKAWGMRMENSPPADKFIDEGDVVTFGEESLKVLATPGHSLGSVSLLCGNTVFAGDTLFAGSIGRTDFPGGSHPQLIASVREKLFVLPDSVKVYPGHGPATTIGQEKRFNPFFS
jgi:glyoxylase-like metal-dependent hydrolase (beta-lactamase superfamily II)